MDIEAIRNIIEGDVENSSEILDVYSRDASLFEMRPKVVVYPKHSKDVQAIVRWAAAQKEKFPEISIVARAAGTDMSGGALGEWIILDTTRYMHGITALEKETEHEKMGKVIGGYATVLPGTFYRDFDVETRKLGLIMPAYTASRELCAVGGMVANNAGGEKTIYYGKVENYIRELKVVFHDGYEYIVRPMTRKELMTKISEVGFEAQLYKELYHLIVDNWDTISAARPNVSKNSAGYYLWNVWDPKTETFDLCRLIVGSQGTLGIVTEITFDLVPVKQHSVMTVVFMKDLQNLGKIVNVALAQHPESIESYDDNTIRVAVKFFKDFLRKKKIWGMLKFMWSFVPEFFMTLAGGVPKMILLIEFAGNDQKEIQQKALSLGRALKMQFGSLTHVTHSEAEENKYWDVRHESFNLLRKHVHGRHTAPFIDDFVVRPEVLPEFLPRADAILATYKLTYTIAGHPGDGNFHIIPLMDLKDPKTREIILELSDKIYDLVLEYKGSITAEHNDGIIRSPYLLKQYGPVITSYFAEVKKFFDPQGLFNPHKKVGVTKADIEKYLSHGDYGQAAKK